MADLHRTCAISGEEFMVTQAEQDHIAKFVDAHPLLREGDIPLPTIHPLEQARQMQSYVSLMHLYEGKSVISAQPLITRYNPLLGYRVCTYEEFWSDQVDNISTGREYDFSRPFFEQWNELLHSVTMQPLVQINCENSAYVDSSSHLQDCYLCFGMAESRGCFYCVKSRYPLHNTDCVDCVGISFCELCYSAVDSEHCYDCQHVRDCFNCYQCFGSWDLIGCKYCFGCVGLRQSEYFIFNQFVGKEKYEVFIKTANVGSFQSRQQWLKKCQQFWQQNHHQVVSIKNCENSSGHDLIHCKNAYECYFGESLEDCGWTTGAYGKDIWRGEVYQGQLSYNSVILSGQLGFGNSISSGSENFYSYMIFNCNCCFGCSMLKQKSYCILNKQYSKAEYQELVPRIIAHMQVTGEWGQFLPSQYAPHFYEESQAYEWFEKLSPENARQRHYRVRGIENSEKKLLQEGVPADSLADDIKNITPELIANLVIICSETGRQYKLPIQEIRFYQKQNIPLPRVHWQVRLSTLRRA